MKKRSSPIKSKRRKTRISTGSWLDKVKIEPLLMMSSSDCQNCWANYQSDMAAQSYKPAPQTITQQGDTAHYSCNACHNYYNCCSTAMGINGYGYCHTKYKYYVGGVAHWKPQPGCQGRYISPCYYVESNTLTTLC